MLKQIHKQSQYRKIKKVCHSTTIGTRKPRVEPRVDEILPPPDLSKQLSSKTSPPKRKFTFTHECPSEYPGTLSPISFPPPHLRFPWFCKLSNVPLKKRLAHHYKCKAFFLTFRPTFFQHPIIMLVKALFLN